MRHTSQGHPQERGPRLARRRRERHEEENQQPGVRVPYHVYAGGSLDKYLLRGHVRHNHHLVSHPMTVAAFFGCPCVQ